MGGSRKHGKVKEAKFKPAEGRLMGVIEKIEKELLSGECFTYKEILESEEWNVGIGYTRQLIMGLVEREHLVRVKPGKFRSILPKSKEERKISSEARKYIALIDEKLRKLRADKEKAEKELERIGKNLKQISSDTGHLERLRQELIRRPELAELAEELKKL